VPECEHVRRGVEAGEEIERVGVAEDEEGPEHEADVAETLITNALMPGAVAVVRRYQKEISR
jgi:hypothetical protein